MSHLTKLTVKSVIRTNKQDPVQQRRQKLVAGKVGRTTNLEQRLRSLDNTSVDEVVEDEEERIAEVRVSKATKKGQVRFVQTQPSANNALKEWQKASPHNARTDYVWFGQQRDADGKATPIGDLNKSFQQYLRAIEFDGRQHGLLNDRDGDRRSLYSLRHTYATQRLEKGGLATV
jgi:integrase